MQKKENLNQRKNNTNTQTLEEEDEVHSKDKCQSKESSHNLKSKIYNYIGSFAQAPGFLQDNRFIHHGYRINYDSPKKVFKT